MVWLKSIWQSWTGFFKERKRQKALDKKIKELQKRDPFIYK